MTKYHINSKHMPGVCKAKNKCPYGDLTNDHYGSQEEAVKAIETQALVETTYEKAISEYDDNGAIASKTLKELQKAKEKLGDDSTFDKNYLSKINSLESAVKDSEGNSTEKEELSFTLPHNPNEGEVRAHQFVNNTMKIFVTSKGDENIEYLENARRIIIGELNDVNFDIKVEKNKDSFIEEKGSKSLSNFEAEKEYYENAISKINERIKEVENKTKTNPQSAKDSYSSNFNNDSNEANEVINAIKNNEKFSSIAQEKGFNNATEDIKSLMNNFPINPGNEDLNGENFKTIHEIIDGERINSKIEIDSLSSDASNDEREYADGVYRAYIKAEDEISKKLSNNGSNSTSNNSKIRELNGESFKPTPGQDEKDYHTNIALANRIIDQRNKYKSENNLPYSSPEKYITTNAGRMNPFDMTSTDALSKGIIIDNNKNKDSSFVILSQADGKRARVVMGYGEELKDLESEFGKTITQEKHGVSIGRTDGLKIVGYISKDGEKFGYIPNKSVSFFTFD